MPLKYKVYVNGELVCEGTYFGKTDIKSLTRILYNEYLSYITFRNDVIKDKEIPIDIKIEVKEFKLTSKSSYLIHKLKVIADDEEKCIVTIFSDHSLNYDVERLRKEYLYYGFASLYVCI